MREAAADLEFETAARLRDEIKRLRETELAIADDPLARQTDVEDKAGAFAGDRKYGPKANMPRSPSPRSRGEATAERASRHEGEGRPRRLTHPARVPARPAHLRANHRHARHAREEALARRHGPRHRPPRASARPDAVSRIRKPTLDEMGSAANRPIPARAPDVDPRTKAGAYGEQVKGPHKPTLDEMGPHAERGLPVAGKPVPPKPQARPNSPPPGGEGLGVGGIPPEKKKHRHGRARKTGRPGA